MMDLGEFPPDVMREAEYWWRKDGCSTPNANLYARAILAERERAAKIARSHVFCDWSKPRGEVVDGSYGEAIAAAIRKGD